MRLREKNIDLEKKKVKKIYGNEQYFRYCVVN